MKESSSPIKLWTEFFILETEIIAKIIILFFVCPKTSVTLMAFRSQIRCNVSLRTKEAKF